MKRPLTVQFAGGEPLLNWELIEAVTEYVEKQRPGTRLQLQTNGISMDRQKADYIREHKIATGVSLDGIPEVNERLRGRTAEAVAGIRTLGEAGVYVNLNAVVTSVNVQKLPQLVDFAWYLESVAGIGLDLLRAAGRGEEAFAQLRADGAELVQALWKMEERSHVTEQLSRRKENHVQEGDKAARREKEWKTVAILLYFLQKRGGGVAKWRLLSMWILSGQAGVLYGKCHGSGALPSIRTGWGICRSGEVCYMSGAAGMSGCLPVEKNFKRRNRRGLCDATHGVSDCGAERCLNWY